MGRQVKNGPKNQMSYVDGPLSNLHVRIIGKISMLNHFSADTTNPVECFLRYSCSGFKTTGTLHRIKPHIWAIGKNYLCFMCIHSYKDRKRYKMLNLALILSSFVQLSKYFFLPKACEIRQNPKNYRDQSWQSPPFHWAC